MSLDFLPPKTHPWQQFTTRYSSKKLFYAGATAGTAALLLAGAFVIQQWQLSRLRSQWSAISLQVTELENLQQQIRKFRPWFDDSLRSLSILRRLAEAFPEDGVVSAKTVEIRELAAVTCSGSAKDSPSLQATMDRLRATKEIGNLKVEQVHGSAPLQFTFNFQWVEGGRNEH